MLLLALLAFILNSDNFETTRYDVWFSRKINLINMIIYSISKEGRKRRESGNEAEVVDLLPSLLFFCCNCGDNFEQIALESESINLRALTIN